jgi:ribosomal protein S18 acetylase RimI-like enzyme
MNRIAELPVGQATEWSVRDRTFTVERELKLHLVDGVLTYGVVAVPAYEQTYPLWQRLSLRGTSFAVYVGNRVAAQIDVSKGWNGFAHIENLIVAQDFRRQGLSRALVERAVAWAQSKLYPGVMVETQNNNVSACQLYASCGFKLQGFDSCLYRGLNPQSQEVALFWYRQVQERPA